MKIVFSYVSNGDKKSDRENFIRALSIVSRIDKRVPKNSPIVLGLCFTSTNTISVSTVVLRDMFEEVLHMVSLVAGDNMGVPTFKIGVSEQTRTLLIFVESQRKKVFIKARRLTSVKDAYEFMKDVNNGKIAWDEIVRQTKPINHGFTPE